MERVKIKDQEHYINAIKKARVGISALEGKDAVFVQMVDCVKDMRKAFNLDASMDAKDVLSHVTHITNNIIKDGIVKSSEGEWRSVYGSINLALLLNSSEMLDNIKRKVDSRNIHQNPVVLGAFNRIHLFNMSKVVVIGDEYYYNTDTVGILKTDISTETYVDAIKRFPF